MSSVTTFASEINSIGGADMNSEIIKNNDSLQLQQMIIFLKAELAKYKYEVKKFQDSYHYSLAEELERENVQLTNEKNELSKELLKLTQELEKRTSDDKERIQLQGMLGKRYITSIDTVWRTKTDIQPINKQLTEVLKKLKDGGNTSQYRYRKHDRQVSTLLEKLSDNKTTIEQLEYKLVNVIQEANKEVHTQLEKLKITNKERTQFEKVRQRLVKEVEGKNKTIMKLQYEMSNLKAQNEKNKEAISMLEKNMDLKNDRQSGIGPISSTPTIDTDTLMQLDHQIKELLAKSLDYEGQLDAKLLVLNTLEHKLEQLAGEIDDIKVFSVEGRV